MKLSMEKKSILQALLPLALSATVCQTALATDGNITFTGTILDSACTVAVANNNAINVGIIQASSFTTSGEAIGNGSFNIHLTGCPASINTASVFFEGNVDPADTSLFQLTAPTGTGQTMPTGFGIGIYTADTNKKINPGTLSDPITLTGAKNAQVGDLKFVAKAVSTSTTVTPGTIAGSVTYTMQYN